jgi:hypothetical protein
MIDARLGSTQHVRFGASAAIGMRYGDYRFKLESSHRRLLDFDVLSANNSVSISALRGGI